MRMENLVTQMGATSGSILLIDEASGDLTYDDGYNTPHAWQEGAHSLKADRLYMQVNRDRATVIANHHPQQRDGVHIESSLVAPIWKGGEIAGYIEVVSDDPDATFNQDDVATLDAFAREYGARQSVYARFTTIYAVCGVVLLWIAPDYLESRIGFAASNVAASPVFAALCALVGIYAIASIWLIKSMPVVFSNTNSVLIILATLYFGALSIL